MYLASLEGGYEIIAEEENLQDLYDAINKLGFTGETTIVVMQV